MKGFEHPDHVRDVTHLSCIRLKILATNHINCQHIGSIGSQLIHELLLDADLDCLRARVCDNVVPDPANAVAKLPLLEREVEAQNPPNKNEYSDLVIDIILNTQHSGQRIVGMCEARAHHLRTTIVSVLI